MASLTLTGRADQATLKASTGRSRSRFVWWTIYAASVAVLMGFLIDGYSYYTTPYSERPHREDYRDLRPAGGRSLLFGTIGSAMMILMHLYSLRKRVRRLSCLGPIAHWLNVHIYFGVIGPLLIVLHTSFKVNGLVAVSFWSMVGVAISGFVGRYLYQQIPRNIRGDQLSVEELRKQSEYLREHLHEEYGLSRGAVLRLDELTGANVAAEVRPLRAFLLLVGSDLRHLWRLRELEDVFICNYDIPVGDSRRLARMTLDEAILRRRIRFLTLMRKLFHHWHVIHKPFAVVMYTIMAVHISVALWTGYGWTF